MNYPDWVCWTKSTTAGAPSQATVGTTAGQAVAANGIRKRLMIQNTGTTVLYLSYGTTDPTSSNYHVALAACSSANDGTGGVLIDEMWRGSLQIISSAPGGTYVATELT